MNVVAINGSPRKNWNTAILLNKALEGAAAKNASTELIHLYDLNFKGCVSCFACKQRGGKSYIERLLFQYLVYDENYSSLNKKKKKTGLIYAMNVPETMIKEVGYDLVLSHVEKAFERVMGPTESLFVTDTYQFSDYSKYVATAFNAAAKLKRREEVFPIDCEKAFAMGARLADNSL